MDDCAVDVTFTLAAAAGDAFPSYRVEMLKPGPYTLSAVRHVDDRWNAYVRKPQVPAQRYGSMMRVFDNTCYAGMARIIAGVEEPAAPPLTMLEYGVINVGTVDEAFDGLGRHHFKLLDWQVRPVMFAIYIGLGNQHSGGITLRLQSGIVSG